MKEVLILGNGTSRLQYSNYIKSWKNDLFICNYSFLEHENFPKIDIVGTVHEEVAIKAYEYKIKNNLDYTIYFTKPIKDYENKIDTFGYYHGFSTGMTFIEEALNSGYQYIYLLGFDSVNNNNSDIYTKNLIISNFQNQYKQIIKDYNLKVFNSEKDLFILKRNIK